METSASQSIEAELLATEAVMTSRIENVKLDRDTVLRLLRHLMGLDTDSSATGSYEMSVAKFTLDVHLNFAEPLAAERLFSWHEKLMNNSLHRLMKPRLVLCRIGNQLRPPLALAVESLCVVHKTRLLSSRSAVWN